MTSKTVALSTSATPRATTDTGLLDVATKVGARDFALHKMPKSDAHAMRTVVRSRGLTVHGIDIAFSVTHGAAQRRRILLDAQRVGGELRVSHLVLDLGDIGTDVDRDARRYLTLARAASDKTLGDGDVEDSDVEGSVWQRYLDARDERREDAVEAWARQLHPFHGAGTPIAFRPATDGVGLLGIEEMGWLLDELPQATLWLDLAALNRMNDTAAPWLDAYADRTTAVLVSGSDAQGAGAHPQRADIDWAGIGSSMPGRAIWVLAMRRGHSDGDVSDGLAYLQSRVAT